MLQTCYSAESQLQQVASPRRPGAGGRCVEVKSLSLLWPCDKSGKLEQENTLYLLAITCTLN